MTYTEYKLTDSMLQHLSATANRRQVGGMSMRALYARGLVEQPRPHAGPWYITILGQQALDQARLEGW